MSIWFVYLSSNFDNWIKEEQEAGDSMSDNDVTRPPVQTTEEPTEDNKSQTFRIPSFRTLLRKPNIPISRIPFTVKGRAFKKR